MCVFFFFFFNDPATTDIYTLSLHDALPIWSGVASISTLRSSRRRICSFSVSIFSLRRFVLVVRASEDRKSTRLNSSHANISYAVFCLKKKKKKNDLMISELHRETRSDQNLY